MPSRAGCFLRRRRRSARDSRSLCSLALGADPGQVVRLVTGRGLRIVGWATVLGLAVSLAAVRLLRSRLYGISPTDPLTFVAVPAVLAAVAAFACYLPARRAARVDPVIALRAD